MVILTPADNDKGFVSNEAADKEAGRMRRRSTDFTVSSQQLQIDHHPMPPSVGRSKPWLGGGRFIDLLTANSCPRRRWSSERALVSALIAVALCVNSISCQQQGLFSVYSTLSSQKTEENNAYSI